MKKTVLCFLVLSVVTGVSFAKEKIASSQSSDSHLLNIEICEENANIFGYLLTVSNACGYEINNSPMNDFTETSKKCTNKFGNKKMYNATMAAVHEAKNDMANHERGEMCSDFYKENKDFF